MVHSGSSSLTPSKPDGRATERDVSHQLLEAPHPQQGPAAKGLAGVERWTVSALTLFGALLRVAYVFRHDVNIDEPQHLHVAWGWTRGLLPYRDLFDNHSPMLGVLFAPVLAWLGPRPDIVICMRLAMVPFTLLTLWGLWILVNRLFGIRAAAWTVAVAGVHPDFIERGVEYRSDVPWMALWICSLAVLLTLRSSTKRSFAGGLLMGAAFMTSMKTCLLVAGLLLAAIGTALVYPHARWMVRGSARRIGAALAGMVVVPALFGAFFALNHAWSQFVDGLVLYNLMPGLGQWESTAWLPLIAIPIIPVLFWTASHVIRFAPNEHIGVLRSVLFLTATIYWLGIQTCWPLVTRQDWLPFVPMAAGLLVPLALGPVSRSGFRSGVMAWRRTAWVAPFLFTTAELITVSVAEPAWKDKTSTQRETLGAVLRLSRPSEWVLDQRGESIFRRRPIRTVLEAIALERIRRGLLCDDIEERARATRAPVAFADNDEWPTRGRKFLNRTYISVGLWRVLGCRLTKPPNTDSSDFEITIPERYAVVCRSGPGRGVLDGLPYTGARVLIAGRHTYRAAKGGFPAAVIWAPALERGFRPTLQ